LDLGVDDNEDLALDVDDGMAEQDPEALDSDDEDDGVNSELQLEESDGRSGLCSLKAPLTLIPVPMHIVPLYSLLPSDKQMKVFGHPLCRGLRSCQGGRNDMVSSLLSY
jgi:ATP-dependent RNA helicase DHX37/DHR1